MKLLSFILGAACAASALPLDGLDSQLGPRGSSSSLSVSTASHTPSALFSQPVPTATLLPAVHWNQDTSSKNLRPKDSHQLYYANGGIADPNESAHIAYLTFKFLYPSVVLEHIDSVQKVTCSSNNTMTINFGNSTAFSQAIASWPSNHTSFVLVNYAEGCGDYGDGQRSFFLVKSFIAQNKTLTVVATGSMIALEDAASDCSIDWSHYQPGTERRPSPKGNQTHGLPTAPLGDDFDEILDDQLGFYNASGDITEVPSDVEGSNVYEDDPLPPGNDSFRRSTTPFDRRGFGIPFLTTPGNIPLNFNTQIEIPKDPTLTASPFGQAVLITSIKDPAGSDSKFDIFCVDCGIKGGVNISGHAEFSLATGATEAVLDVHGNLAMGLQIGIDAQITLTQNVKPRIFTLPLSILNIPGIVVIGPEIFVEANFTFTASAKGQLLVGATVSLPEPQSHIDLIDSKKSNSSGWTPEFTPILKANGKISLSAELGLPITVGFGVDILNGAFKKHVGLVDEPSIVANATISASTPDQAPPSQGATKRGLAVRDDCNNGVEMEITFKNRLFVNLLDIKEFDLSNFSKTLAKQCIPLTSQLQPRDNSTLASFDYQLPDVAFTSYTDVDGTTWGRLFESTGSYKVISCANSNIYLQQVSQDTEQLLPCIQSWAIRNNETVADGSGLVLHYYSNTMSVLGVSRLRTSDEDDMPNTGVFVTLSPSSTGASSLVALDPVTKCTFQPVICTFKDQPSKIFLVKDLTKGIETLKGKEVVDTVTGGVVQDCEALDLVISE